MKLSERKIGVTAMLIAGVVIAATVLGTLALLWLLWCFVLPQICPACPAALINPSYWLFIAMWVLALTVCGLFRRPK
jgi:hypothetical protein